jgi:hypothetical protein
MRYCQQGIAASGVRAFGRSGIRSLGHRCSTLPRVGGTIVI